MTMLNYYVDVEYSMPSTTFGTGSVWTIATPSPPTHASQNTTLRDLALDNIAKEFESIADRAKHAAEQARKLRNLPQVRDEPRKAKKR